MTMIIAGAVTFFFTTLLTIAGVGAAFVLIPVFIALGVEVHVAMATALLLNAVGMAVASVTFVRKRLVVWPLALPMLVVATLLSPLGAWVSQSLDRSLLLWLFTGFLLFAALMMLFYRPQKRDVVYSRRLLLGLGMGVGGFAGFLGGLIGVGGGNIIVPVLVFLGFDPKKASGTTSFIVIFSSLAGFLGHASLAGVEGVWLGTMATASA
ncbi:sulfite exporter TauE/SafE family protein, partial [Myxococcota bacterium]|nr:sulfite exporter TauE/SafE family protein [Myxococcota bacterium]